MATANDVLTRAYDLVCEFGICRGAYAQNDRGETIGTRDRAAQSFCAVGAIVRAADEFAPGDYPLQELLTGAAFYALTQARQNVQPEEQDIVRWNDNHTDAEVKQAFRDAIEDSTVTHMVSPEHDPVLFAAVI